METLHKREDDGTASHWTMTRREFFATRRDLRNSPGRTDTPLKIALCPKTGATVCVPVLFVCPHNVKDKVFCSECLLTSAL